MKPANIQLLTQANKEMHIYNVNEWGGEGLEVKFVELRAFLICLLIAGKIVPI